MISSLRGGGSERQTLLLLKHLDRQRFTPHLYLVDRAGALLDQLPDDVVVHAYSDRPPSGGWYYPGRELRRQSQHVHSVLLDNDIRAVYDRTFQMSLIAAQPAGRLGVPRVSTIVSPPHLAVPLVEKRFVQLKKRRLIQAYRSSAQVVAVSQQAADSAVAYYQLGSTDVRVIPNPVDHATVQSAATESVATETSSAAGPRFVCVARMTEEKGHEDLLLALGQVDSLPEVVVPNLTIDLIGDGPLRESLQRQWQSQSHRHHVHFHGAIENPVPWIARADALVLPSRFEGMPNVVLEAMALSTPVIATRSGGTLDLERECPTIWWAQPANPSSLAGAIESFFGGGVEVQQRVDAAFEMTQVHHDVHQTVREIESLMATVIDSSHSSGRRNAT
ncbi:MAG: glycosyltransferase [Planctomycetota bacterium]